MNAFINVMSSFVFSSWFTGRKAYGDWEIAEVLKVFLEKNGRTYRDIAKFDMSK
jgi:hypothetical protein